MEQSYRGKMKGLETEPGMDATKKLSGEGFESSWQIIKRDEAVR